MSSVATPATVTDAAAAGGVVVESDHDKKYDRQMRLWGAHGQKKLQTASICVLHSGATSAEVLKNLVLPNVGEFTIVDDAIVQQSDLGNNFFCDEEHLGQPRAETVTKLLREMNPDVVGHAVCKPAVDVVRDNVEFFAPFRLVIATQMPRDAMLTLAAFCYERAIPLIVLQAYGLVARMRVCVPEHLITESHPMNSRIDLYMHADQLAHFPALQEYVDSFEPDAMTKAEMMQHAHVPFPVLLVKAMARWRAAHDGAAPKSYAETTAFKETIKAESREWRARVDPSTKSAPSEQNYDEAVQHAFRCVSLPETDWMTQAVLDDARAKPANQSAETPPFWILVRALNAFVAAEGHGFLPVSQDIPDMTSETDNYVRLKRVFKQKSDEDCNAVAAHVAAALSSLSLPAATITNDDVAYFCKHVRDLRCVRMRSLAQEYAADSFNVDAVNQHFEEWRHEPPFDEDAPMYDPRMLHWYVALRAAEEFQSVHGRWPGVDADGRHLDGESTEFADDKKTLIALAKEFTATNKIAAPVFEQCCEELVRYRACEMHNIAAYIGAVGAQAALKLLLEQYVPANNTYLYNGIHCKSVTVTL